MERQVPRRRSGQNRVAALTQFRAAGQYRHRAIGVDPDGGRSQRVGAGVAAGASDGAAVPFGNGSPQPIAFAASQILLERAVKGAHAGKNSSPGLAALAKRNS